MVLISTVLRAGMDAAIGDGGAESAVRVGVEGRDGRWGGAAA